MNSVPTLATLAEVHTAVVFRDQAPQEHPEGNVRALAIRDVVAATPVSWSELPRVVVAEKYRANCLQAGDVVIPSRGDYYRALLFTGADLPVLPVGQLNVIRPVAGLDAGYLVWFLNLPTTGAKLKHMLTGTSIKALTKMALQTLEVKLPDMERQRHIAAIDELAGRIAAIRHRLTELDTIEVAEIADVLSHGGGGHA